MLLHSYIEWVKRGVPSFLFLAYHIPTSSCSVFTFPIQIHFCWRKPDIIYHAAYWLTRLLKGLTLRGPAQHDSICDGYLCHGVITSRGDEQADTTPHCQCQQGPGTERGAVVSVWWSTVAAGVLATHSHSHGMCDPCLDSHIIIILLRNRLIFSVNSSFVPKSYSELPCYISLFKM